MLMAFRKKFLVMLFIGTDNVIIRENQYAKLYNTSRVLLRDHNSMINHL